MKRNRSGCLPVVSSSRIAILLGSLCLLLGWAAAPPSAEATVLRGLSLKQLCAGSQQIVRGTVLETRAHWHGGRILTAVTLRVDRALAGDRRSGQRVTFYRLGGEVGGIGQRVIGAARFRPGEQVVVFLRARRGRLRVHGMFQGKLRVIPAAAGKPARVTPPVSRAALRGRKRALVRPVALSDFEARVRALIHDPRQRPRPGGVRP